MTKQTRNAHLIETIRDKIRRDGPVTFDWFMEQALYHPEHGYYSSGRARIGRKGDYFTNVSVGSVFGELLARQLGEIWETLGRPDPFTIVEQGAHSGEFAADVLSLVAHRMPDFATALRYCIVEPFPALRSKQRTTLQGRAEQGARGGECRPWTGQRPSLQVSWRESLDELEPFCGVHFSNELVDAMPIHLVALPSRPNERRENLTSFRRQVSHAQWQEKYVAEDGGNFVFVRWPLSNSALQERLQSIPAGLVPPYETEVNLRVPAWIAAVSRKLTRGYILAVDYGYPRDEYYAPHRSAGTLRCYAQHRVIDSPLSHVGEADITAHVDWTSVAQHALDAGLQLAGFTDQHHFLTGILSTFAEGELTQLNRNQLQTLLQPTMLGRTFQFLALSKNLVGRDGCHARSATALQAGARRNEIPSSHNPHQLSGFKFARDPQIALGLAAAH